MNSFAYQFNKTQESNPYWSSWVCFYKTMNKLNIKDKKKMRRYFNKLVDKNDYLQSEKNQLINYLMSHEFWK